MPTAATMPRARRGATGALRDSACDDQRPLLGARCARWAHDPSASYVLSQGRRKLAEEVFGWV